MAEHNHPEYGDLNNYPGFAAGSDASKEIAAAIDLYALQSTIAERSAGIPVKNAIEYEPNFIAIEGLRKDIAQVSLSLNSPIGSFSKNIPEVAETLQFERSGYTRCYVTDRLMLDSVRRAIDFAWKCKRLSSHGNEQNRGKKRKFKATVSTLDTRGEIRAIFDYCKANSEGEARKWFHDTYDVRAGAKIVSVYEF
jgi:hypothetical protein